MNSKLFRKFYTWHRWLGYFLSAHLILLFLSGIILVFRAELSPLRPLPSKTSTPLTLGDIAALSQEQNPNDRLLALSVNDDDPMLVTARMGQDGSTRFSGSKRILFDRRSGRVEAPKEKNSILDTILVFHREFLLGFYGKLYVGVIGILFVLSLLSGLLVYGPTTKLEFGAIRRGFSKSLTWIDAHKFLGATCVLWLLLVGTTGVLLSFSGQLLRLYQYSTLKTLEARYAAPVEESVPTSIDQAEKAIRARGVEGEIAFISFPGSEFSTAAHFIFVIDKPSSWTRKEPIIALVNAQNGGVDEILGLPWYLQATVLAEPLHFGNYGGLTLKIFWSLLGTLGLGLVASSLMIVVKKRQTNGVEKRMSPIPKRRIRNPYFGPALMSAAFALSLGAVLATDGRLSNFWAATLLLPLAYIAYKILGPSLNS